MSDEQTAFIGVADGMGGHKGGRGGQPHGGTTLRDALAGPEPAWTAAARIPPEANRAIYEQQLRTARIQRHGHHHDRAVGGCDRVLLGHVGDSRAYLSAGRELRQISQDHSMVAEMVRGGSSPRRRPGASLPQHDHPGRGHGPKPWSGCAGTGQAAGDLWLLCSDGLTEYVEDAEMPISCGSMSPEAAVDQLLNLALQAAAGTISPCAAEVDA